MILPRVMTYNEEVEAMKFYVLKITDLWREMQRMHSTELSLTQLYSRLNHCQWWQLESLLVELDNFKVNE